MKAVPSGIWKYLVLAFAAAVIYLPSLDGPFLLDDNWKIVRNPVVHGQVPVPLTSRYIGDQSFRLNYLVGGLDPRAWRTVNILIHAAAAVSLFAFLARIHAAVSGAAVCTCLSMAGPAWWIALLWAVHPLQTESVAYVCQRFESLAALFYLITLYGFVRAVQGSRTWYVVSLAACMSGMATKETMVTAPFMILLIDGVVLSKSWRDALRRNWRLHAGYMLTLGVLGALWVGTLAEGARAGEYGITVVSPWTYLLTQSTVVLHYLRQTVFPVDLCFDYAWPWVDGFRGVRLQFLALSVLGLSTLAALVLRRRAAVCFAAFLLLLAPTSSLFPLYDAAAEHRMYLPLACVICIVVFASWRLLTRDTAGNRQQPGTCARLWILLPLCAAVFLGVMTMRRCDLYGDAARMWASVVAVRPNNLRAWNELATVFLERGEWQKAEGCSREIVERTRGIEPIRDPVVLSPHSPVLNRMNIRANMGTWALANGDLDKALALLSEAVALYPYAPDVEQKLLAVLRRQGVTPETLESAAQAAVWRASGRLAGERN